MLRDNSLGAFLPLFFDIFNTDHKRIGHIL